ncbi:NAD(P)-binding protein [Xylariaceae sp. FL0255]|nr:NAD(P)-binding protein [Xylariaceae sp. FL0255]
MAPVPKVMKAVLINKTGGTEVLEYKTDVPVPTPIDGNILVKNDLVGVNFIDTYFRTGLYPAPQFPYMLGREAEGTVVATGNENTHGIKVGDRVAYLCESGAYAEYTSAMSSKAVKLPDTLAFKKPGVGAATLLQGLTAVTLIRESYPVQKGDWILVHAAAGGTGLLLCQLLRAIGAHTIGTASTDAKLKLASANGVAHTINTTTTDAAGIKARVLELTNGVGVAAVFDGVGKATFDLSLDCLARKGTLVSFGNASGAVPPFTIGRLTAKNAKVLRPTMVNYIVTQEEWDGYVKELFDFIEGGFEVSIHETIPLSEVKRAQEDLEGRKTTGKVLLDPSK